MRPPPAAVLLALLAVLAACSGGERPSAGETTTTTIGGDPDAPLAPDVRAFLARAEAGAGAAFTAEYAVLSKLGGAQSTVLVESAPPAVRITVGDLVVVDGPTPATCDRAARTCEGRVREERLAPFGIFSRFATTGPISAIRTLAGREDASEPQLSERTSAGVSLSCVAVPVQQAITATWCTTPEGVFGYVDNPSVRYELTRYQPGPPAAPVVPPFPVTG